MATICSGSVYLAEVFFRVFFWIFLSIFLDFVVVCLDIVGALLRYCWGSFDIFGVVLGIFWGIFFLYCIFC